MGKKRVMLPVEEIDASTVKYQPQKFQAPHLSGLSLKLFTWAIESPLLGPIITSALKRQNNMTQLLRHTVIPESPMYRPEYPPQEPEPGVVFVDEEKGPVFRVETALGCLTPYDPCHWKHDGHPFLYWTIRDFAHAYHSKLATPSAVAEHIISAVEEFNNKKPPMPLLISFSAEDVRKQAAASTQRFEGGNPLSILDGIFIAIKDDIDCYPYPSKGATTWFHKVHTVKEDAVCVSRLRNCGAIPIGKANMHELGMGTSGNNPNYGFHMARGACQLNKATLVSFEASRGLEGLKLLPFEDSATTVQDKMTRLPPIQGLLNVSFVIGDVMYGTTISSAFNLVIESSCKPTRHIL